MNVFFVRAFLAVVGLCLILTAVGLFAEKDHFIPAARAIWHDLYLEKVH
jgi:hypothetical protein